MGICLAYKIVYESYEPIKKPENDMDASAVYFEARETVYS